MNPASIALTRDRASALPRRPKTRALLRQSDGSWMVLREGVKLGEIRKLGTDQYMAYPVGTSDRFLRRDLKTALAAIFSQARPILRGAS